VAQVGKTKDIRKAVEGELIFDPLVDPANVTALVQDALDRYALVADDSDVAVDTRGNTVRLTGHVRTWAERDAVVAAAWMASGVMDVVDELHIAS
jgi:osmotically-inducible protein OsmY